MKLIISLGLLIFYATHGLCQNVVWVSEKNVIEVTQNIYILKTTDTNLNIETVSSDSYKNQFYLTDQSVLHFGFTESAYWLRFSLDNYTKDSLWLELEHAFIPNAILYFKDSVGNWRFYEAGYKIHLANKVIKNHFQLFPLQKGRNEYYLKIIPLVHPIPVKIWNSSVYQLRADKQRIVYGIYSGILFFAIAINVFLFVLFRKLYYLLYALLVFCYVCASAAVMEGYIIYYFPDTDLMMWYKIIPVLSMPALLLYCNSFLELKKINLKLYRLSFGTCLFLFIYILTGLQFLPQLTILLINYLLAMIVFIIAISIGVTVGRNGNRIGYYFTIAYSIWFLLLIFELIYIQIGRPAHIFDLSYVSIAIFIEAFLLAFLLVKRFQWERKEEEKMRFALQANLILVQQKFQQEIVQTQLEIREQTFHNISQEIHDNIAQSLSLAKLNLSTIQPDLAEDDKAKLLQAKELVGTVIADLRDISKAINSDYIKSIGLIGAIEQQIKILRKPGIFKINYEIIGDEEKYDNNKELFIFRIIQELLNNIVKHAGANHIELIIDYRTNELIISVIDNGKGFDIDNLNRATSSGLGLSNIKDRAKLIGGSLIIESSYGKGAKIILSVPK